jgi:phosphoribosylformylglycinamidine (FGAM) synthase-like enzyme
VIGMVGRLPDPARAGRLAFATEGDAIALIGAFAPARAGSELAKLCGEEIAGPLPALDADAASAAHATVRTLVNTGALRSAHDIAEGGIAVALAESCIAGEIGATVTLPDGLDPFAEAPGRAFIVSGPDAALTGQTIIGRVGGDRLAIAGSLDVDVDVAALERARSGGLTPFV